ncbi:hypothetical protein AC578_1720 [Pseudocercospora eumusae]|uniref:RING-type domain-containing protein n=1 Tax=Pseudocercospora eumusae TaxID=321146 RepID=A0A139GWB9_9PEZI|nr:hypothetical protein AC578_1720 [Pseudocercospora eumusae]
MAGHDSRRSRAPAAANRPSEPDAEKLLERSNINFWNLTLAQHPPRKGDVYVLKHQTAGRSTSSQLQLLMVFAVGYCLGQSHVMVADLLAPELDFWQYEDIRVKSNLERLRQNPERCQELARHARPLSSIVAAPDAFVMLNPPSNVISKLRRGGHCLNPMCYDGYCEFPEMVYAFYPELRAGRSTAEMDKLVNVPSPNLVLCPDCHGVDLTRHDEELAILWSRDRFPDIRECWEHIQRVQTKRAAVGLTPFTTRHTVNYMHAFEISYRHGSTQLHVVGRYADCFVIPGEEETTLPAEHSDFWDPHEPENPSPKTSKKAIARLRHQKFLSYRTTNPDEPQTSCSVCLDDFTNASTVIRLDCKHVFHAKCIVTWLEKSKNSCPLCRKEVTERASPEEEISEQDTED